MQARVEAFIESRAASEPFERLALDLFEFQFERVPAYRRLCDALGVSPSTVSTWQRIPALPVDAFKHGVLGGGDAPHVLLSSGTTRGPTRPSRHGLSTLSTYRLSALAHFADMVLPDEPGPMSVLVLGPTLATHPHSSLAHMFSWVIERVSDGGALTAFNADGDLDLDTALGWLEEAASRAAPVLVLAVSSALSALLDALRRRDRPLRLPADSRIVDTGGAKPYTTGGRTRTLSPAGIQRAAWRWLHVPAYLFVNEYGMTEMLSQFYDDVLRSRVEGRLRPRAKLGPPWVRTTIVDPVTLEPVAAGTRGLLRHLDLANWETVAALQTLDVGAATGAGFRLLGRAPAAEARGCSNLLRAVASSAERTRNDASRPKAPK